MSTKEKIRLIARAPLYSETWILPVIEPACEILILITLKTSEGLDVLGQLSKFF